MFGLLICVGTILFTGIMATIIWKWSEWSKGSAQRELDKQIEEDFYSQDNFDPVGRMLDEYKEQRKTNKNIYENENITNGNDSLSQSLDSE